MVFAENEFRSHDFTNLFFNMIIINENRKLTYRNRSIDRIKSENSQNQV